MHDADIGRALRKFFLCVTYTELAQLRADRAALAYDTVCRLDGAVGASEAASRVFSDLASSMRRNGFTRLHVADYYRSSSAAGELVLVPHSSVRIRVRGDWSLE